MVQKEFLYVLKKQSYCEETVILWNTAAWQELRSAVCQCGVSSLLKSHLFIGVDILHDAVTNAVAWEQVRSPVPIPDPGPFSVDLASCPCVDIGSLFILTGSLYLNRANLCESLYVFTGNFKFRI